MRIGIIKETKTPADTRTAITPAIAKRITNAHSSVNIEACPSNDRSFKDKEYTEQSIPLNENMSENEVLVGVKEVNIPDLIPNKTYFFFSHTIKKQPYNKTLLQEILQRKIRLIDYECLTNERGQRVIAFGRWAGIVGAHNAIWTWGKRTGDFSLPRAKDVIDYEALKSSYSGLNLPNIKIAVTGGGRVAKGAIEVLEAMKIAKVSPESYISNQFDHPVYAQLNTEDLYLHKENNTFDKSDFYANPDTYKCDFSQYYKVTDVMINAIYWDPKAPAYFTLEEMKQADFAIKTIADITCDIAPEASIPATLRPTTIPDPVFGFNPQTGKEETAFNSGTIDMMTIDNLPNELPRDASRAFAEQFEQYVIPELIKEENGEHSKMLMDATIAQGGELTDKYRYLEDWVNS